MSQLPNISTHILDTARGKNIPDVELWTTTLISIKLRSGTPAAGILVKIFRAERLEGDFGSPEDEDSYSWEKDPIAEVVTNTDGRGQLVFDIKAGNYKIVFYVASYFERSGTPSFYPKVDIIFRIADPSSHYHVPLILGPYGYSTYRGS